MLQVCCMFVACTQYVAFLHVSCTLHCIKVGASFYAILASVYVSFKVAWPQFIEDVMTASKRIIEIFDVSSVISAACIGHLRPYTKLATYIGGTVCIPLLLAIPSLIYRNRKDKPGRMSLSLLFSTTCALLSKGLFPNNPFVDTLYVALGRL